MKNSLVIDMIKQYIHTTIGRDDIEVEIVEDQPVLYKEELWHIYFIPRFTFIGVFIDEDMKLVDDLRRIAPQILDIYNSVDETEDETV